MKKIISLILTMIMSLSVLIGTVVRAEENVKVMFNGMQLQFDQPPIIKDGRTLVPVRAIFEAMGAEVDWNPETHTITATKYNIELAENPALISGVDITIVMQIDNQIMYKNGGEIRIDVAPVIIGNRTLVPVRAVSEAFDCEVSWIEESRTVKINYDQYLERSWHRRAKDSFSRPILDINTVEPVYFDDELQFEVYKYIRNEETYDEIESFKKNVVRLGYYLEKYSNESVLIYKYYRNMHMDSFTNDRIEIHLDKDSDYIIMYQRGAAG